MNQLACPKCHKPLMLDGKTYKCEDHHSYDISKRGYINLLLNPDKSKNNPGDSKESLIARKAYLNTGHYDPILNEVVNYIKAHQKEHMEILDLGCGEGYYTYRMKQLLGNDHTYYGLDISKEAINMATRYDKDIHWIVGNSKNIPINDHSLDVITALFTVVNKDEIVRTLKEDGYMIHVTANRGHLIEIKHLIYDEVKVKSDKFIRLPFEVLESYDFKKTISIPKREDALNLLKMTPHYYHIKKEKRSVLDTLQGLDVTIDLRITVYRP
ncbi:MULTISPECIES: methyltransferase domain-containing protein [Kandleria]|jgi:23S rRNA (guanine745-N1)-methyltransferase|uniref:23S rRNA m(1)G745 methyltransferase n=1 Tax=Kandleria vitulina DSM 20405 TaxID=1410657 RepID=A0A0R2HMR7_9FIRM|nr:MULTISPECIES: methyltransferase domain-containing protein [Kandleria]KRN51404.1 23S rRNA m(1)G745 methyltransferase [Kandleria vitulina DSM 20405]MBP3276572.1 methyltransferase domain-containing protein [Kandleria sp.]MEE0988366.1 methyltransferase domain-containing protein [Kandleria vitulina]SDL29117.1 23S rRNA m(1)G-745 methyltransferase [Kandleria vitulina]SEJ20869.1 23S rRNA m(1)G-745 methyltransferase [Kandleria vitulina]